MLEEEIKQIVEFHFIRGKTRCTDGLPVSVKTKEGLPGGQEVEKMEI